MVEPAEQADLVEIAMLNVEASRQFAARMTPEGGEGLQARLRNVEAQAKRTQFLVVREEGRIVGSVAYCPAGKADEATFPPDWAAILLLAVQPAARGRGLARELVTACIERAGKDGAENIGLFTSELMTAAQRLYESLGFRLESEIPRRHGLRYFRYRLSLGCTESAIHQSNPSRARCPQPGTRHG